MVWGGWRVTTLKHFGFLGFVTRLVPCQGLMTYHHFSSRFSLPNSRYGGGNGGTESGRRIPISDRFVSLEVKHGLRRFGAGLASGSVLSGAHSQDHSMDTHTISGFHLRKYRSRVWHQYQPLWSWERLLNQSLVLFFNNVSIPDAPYQRCPAQTSSQTVRWPLRSRA